MFSANSGQVKSTGDTSCLSSVTACSSVSEKQQCLSSVDARAGWTGMELTTEGPVNVNSGTVHSHWRYPLHPVAKQTWTLKINENHLVLTETRSFFATVVGFLGFCFSYPLLFLLLCFSASPAFLLLLCFSAFPAFPASLFSAFPAVPASLFSAFPAVPASLLFLLFCFSAFPLFLLFLLFLLLCFFCFWIVFDGKVLSMPACSLFRDDIISIKKNNKSKRKSANKQQWRTWNALLRPTPAPPTRFFYRTGVILVSKTYIHKYWYLQCFSHFTAVKPRWNANFEFLLYDEAHKVLQLPVFGALHCSETQAMHHGVTGEPCRILPLLIHAKDDSVLEAEEVQFAPCLSFFLFASWTLF